MARAKIDTEMPTMLPIQPKTEGHRLCLEEIRSHQLTFVTGPAGTGKTHLAVAVGLEMLLASQVNKIVCVRPMVECGRKMGFLPGNEGEKLAPYMKPIVAKLSKLVGEDGAAKIAESGKIDFCTLQTMRGDEFEKCFVILDEAQNCDPHEMKMFLTRMGRGTRAVVNGDLAQPDIDGASGLEHALTRLSRSSRIGFYELTDDDVVRSPLVREILAQWDTPR